MTTSRRAFLTGLSLATFASAAAGQDVRLQRGGSQSFSFDLLKEKAKTLALAPYVPLPLQSAAQALDYEAHGRIRFNPNRALFADGSGPFPATFFHLGRYFQKGVALHEVRDGKSREILYDPALFSLPIDSPAHRLPRDAGFAGFRLQESLRRADWPSQDWLAFLGASYFRAIGELNQYGLSARGIAVNVASKKAEEFPDFTEFYLDAASADGAAIVYALLNGPSLSGAFRIVCRRDAKVVTEVETHLYVRQDIERLGIAPLTSMYWFSETRKPTMADWRPEVHDSDGLQLLTGAGEWLWRPLNNPRQLALSAFSDHNPRGFGLMQRDRSFDHYLDGVHYERRPSAWVEPLGDWGAGFVQLIEIPTDDEIHDNIVAMWVAAEPTRAGAELSYRYRLTWSADTPVQAGLARVVATRLGNGGQPGTDRPKGLRKFLVEFLGGALATLPKGVIPTVELWTSRGVFGAYRHSEAVPNDVLGHWRTQFDLQVDGDSPVELRAVLMVDGKPVSEVWSYQYHPN